MRYLKVVVRIAGLLLLLITIGCCALSQSGVLPLPPITPGEAKGRVVSLSVLMLQPSDVPFAVGSAKFTVLDKDLAVNADENLRVTYATFVHTVLRFAGDRRAKWDFHYSQSEFITAGLYGSPPSTATYKSLYADDWLIACTSDYCEVLARYGELVSIISAPVREFGVYLTMEQFNQLIEAMDKRMARELKR